MNNNSTSSQRNSDGLRIDWDKSQRQINREYANAKIARTPKDHEAAIPSSALHRYLSRTHTRGNFFKFFRDFVKFLDWNFELAGFLQDLINRESVLHRKCLKWKKANKIEKCRKYRDSKTGFFMCSTKFLTKEFYIPWPEDKQYRYLRELRERGFLEVMMKKEPRARWVRINYLFIEQKLDEITGDNEDY